MNEALVKKLHYKQGLAKVINAPEGFRLGIESLEDTQENIDFVLLFVHSSAEAEEWLPKVMQLINEESLFWIAYPKQSSKVKTDINRDILAGIVQNNTSYRAVSIAAIDDKWSALRVRHLKKVITANK